MSATNRQSTCYRCPCINDTRCCKFTAPRINIPTTNVIYREWARAVHDNCITGVRIMHSCDPDLINEAIDKYGSRAVHYAIKTKNYELFDYLLQNNANVNLRGGEQQNTPLHEAVFLQNKYFLQKIFSVGAIDDSILNIHGKTALQLCPTILFRRAYLRAKKFKSRNLANFRQKPEAFPQQSEQFRQRRLQSISHSRTQSGSQSLFEVADDSLLDVITVSSIKLNKATKAQMIAYQREIDGNEIWYRKKISEIELREHTITKFGKIFGLDVDDIGVRLKLKLDSEVHENNRGHMWRNLLAAGEKKRFQKHKLLNKYKNQKQNYSILNELNLNSNTSSCLMITKQTQVYKLLFVLLVSVLKNKNQKQDRRRSFSAMSFLIQHKKHIRDLTVRICRKIPKKKRKIQLSEVLFEEKFYAYLFEIHEEMITEESKAKKASKRKPRKYRL